jgi:hypothetical protein
MKKFVALSLIAPAFLGLAACGGTAATNNTSEDVTTNVDDANLAVDGNIDVANDTVPANAM